MKRLINYYLYTKSIWFMFRLLLAWIFVKLYNIFWMKSKMWIFLLRIANRFCSKEYIFTTPFWKYLCKWLQEYILMNKNYEPWIWNIIKKLSQNHDGGYIINIWCNIWRWTIDLAKNYNYKVLAFEPAPKTYYSLNVNVALSNLLNNVQTFNVALWDKNGFAKFEYEEYHNWSSHIIDNNKNNLNLWWKIIDVPLKKFDDLGIEDGIIKNTRLLIMDVEWFEFNVLRWMKDTLKIFKNISLIIEIWEDSKTKEETIKFLEDLWYKTDKIDESNYLFSKA